MKLEKRKDVKNNFCYVATMDNGVKYSVINIGEMFKSSLSFTGWEAILLNEKNELNTEIMIRKNTKDELMKELESRHQKEKA